VKERRGRTLRILAIVAISAGLGTEVAVTVCGEPAGVAIEVTDHGPGIPAADLDRIFEKFYRVPRVEDADTPGTGLGLSAGAQSGGIAWR